MEVTWFILIAILWTGFFVLEGFDFGVGMLHGVVGKTDAERRVAINSIGPLWDGNEVWLIVAGAGMFAAFPSWYATMFSGFYLALVLLLAALIVRGVSFEFRGKLEGSRWRGTWDLLMTIGSLLAPLLIGVALGNLLHGVPIDAKQEYTGDFVDLLNPYSLFVGLTLTSLCVLHGATFLSLKTTGEVRARSRLLARRLSPVAAAIVVGFAVWTQTTIDWRAAAIVASLFALAATLLSVWALRAEREGWAFAMTAVAMSASVVTLFAGLYPRVMVSSTNAANSLTIKNAASANYTLTVMTIIALIFLPLVLLYQGWTYYVFRRRVHPSTLEEQESPRPVPRASEATGASPGD